MITFLFSPLGRWLAGLGLFAAILTGTYIKGYSDGRSAYKAKIEREIQNAVQTGNKAREDALRNLERTPDGGELPNDGFRRD